MVWNMKQVTVIGGGLGGLTAAITAAEAGASVTLHEAHRTLGGRWRSTPVRRSARLRVPRDSELSTDPTPTRDKSVGMESPVYRAHEGPHVVYRDGPIWAWLRERDLLGATCRVPFGAAMRFRFWHQDRLRAVPPVDFLRALRISRRRDVPVDESFRDWASRLVGDEAAEMGASASGVAVFHPDPGSLSAAFVAERLSRVYSMPPPASYRHGSWGAMFDELGAYARKLGVIIELGSRMTSIGDGITIVATELESARVLLGDNSLEWPSGRAALLDLGVKRDRHDLFVVCDLDTCGWLENFSMPDSTIAPDGEHLIQMQMPIDHESSRVEGVARLEAIADQALPGWRERTTYRLQSLANARTGAVDFPGASWRDRPAIDRGSGVYLVGDRVAAPGLLSEVSLNSGVRAAQLAVAWSR
jgi:glycine/D-amino acid oxidase-like deaminating enzyme